MRAKRQAAHGCASIHGTRISESLGFTWAVRGTRCCALGPVLSPRCNLRAPVDSDRGQLSRHDAGNGRHGLARGREELTPLAFEGLILSPRIQTDLSLDESVAFPFCASNISIATLQCLHGTSRESQVHVDGNFTVLSLHGGMSFLNLKLAAVCWVIS